MTESCDECGWEIAGGRAACRAQFDALLARDFSDPFFFRTHRLFVDVYALQHPDQFCRSTKSLAAHLLDICAILEQDASPAAGFKPLNRWLNGGKTFDQPALPKSRGNITLGDVAGADSDCWEAELRHWAASVWTAYDALHPWARNMLASIR